MHHAVSETEARDVRNLHPACRPAAHREENLALSVNSEAGPRFVGSISLSKVRCVTLLLVSRVIVLVTSASVQGVIASSL